jgi:hypothetical protein
MVELTEEFKMPYVNKKRPYVKEWAQQEARDEKPARAERARARYKLDKEGVDRAGKDIDHKKPVSKGGTNADSNLQVVAPSKNRSFTRNPDHTVKINKPKKKKEK